MSSTIHFPDACEIGICQWGLMVCFELSILVCLPELMDGIDPGAKAVLCRVLLEYLQVLST